MAAIVLEIQNIKQQTEIKVIKKDKKEKKDE